MIIHHNSLAATLDAVNEILFSGRPLSGAEKETARWIAGRQVEAGKQAGLFTPTEDDYQEGVRLFTGERLRTKLAARNILTVEAARALLFFDTGEDILERTNRWLLEQCFASTCTVGECAHSTVGLIRYLAAGGLAGSEKRLKGHIAALSQHRDGQGRWRRFPFYYTLLALSETDLPAAVEEMRYAAPACERLLRRSPKDGAFASRQRAVVERVLMWVRLRK
jgi:hypothetical protein